MKQLSIVFSDDIEERITRALDEAGVEGFIRIAGASGNKFTEPGIVPRTLTWPATMFLVPGVADEQAKGLVARLERYAASCTTDPCLRVIVSSVEMTL